MANTLVVVGATVVAVTAAGYAIGQLLGPKPQFESQANRITIKYATAGGWGPAATLARRWIGNVNNPTWGTGDRYSYVAPNTDDDELYLNIYWRKDLNKYEFACSRMSWAPIDIYFDGNLMASFPEVTAAFTPQIGFVNFV